MEKEFSVRCYAKSELAQLYFPELGKQMARQRLRRWMRKCTELEEKLGGMGYDVNNRIFSAAEVLGDGKDGCRGQPGQENQAACPKGVIRVFHILVAVCFAVNNQSLAKVVKIHDSPSIRRKDFSFTV